jgi:hypothetical protein
MKEKPTMRKPFSHKTMIVREFHIGHPSNKIDTQIGTYSIEKETDR